MKSTIYRFRHLYRVQTRHNPRPKAPRGITTHSGMPPRQALVADDTSPANVLDQIVALLDKCLIPTLMTLRDMIRVPPCSRPPEPRASKGVRSTEARIETISDHPEKETKGEQTPMGSFDPKAEADAMQSLIDAAYADYCQILPDRAGRIDHKRTLIHHHGIDFFTTEGQPIARYRIKTNGKVQWDYRNYAGLIQSGWHPTIIQRQLGTHDGVRNYNGMTLLLFDSVRVDKAVAEGALGASAAETKQQMTTAHQQRMADYHHKAEKRARRQQKHRLSRPKRPENDSATLQAFSSALEQARSVYENRRRGETARFYDALEAWPPYGPIASHLIRLQKQTDFAQTQIGDSPQSRALADQIDFLLNRLGDFLTASEVDLTWGWQDNAQHPSAPYRFILDLPTGQVSFCVRTRFDGPDYTKAFREGSPYDRILRFTAAVLVDADDPMYVLFKDMLLHSPLDLN